MAYENYVPAARAALIIAAGRRSTVTYGELHVAIDGPQQPLPNYIGKVLDAVAQQCIERGEPSLAGLVVNQATGEPGGGFEEGSLKWAAELQRVFRHWGNQR